MSSTQYDMEEPSSAWQKEDEGLQNLLALMPENLNEKISTASTEDPGERREVTVLFLDISNFTKVSHNLDSESVYLFINEAMRLFARVVYKYEGTIDKFTGDGLMALFGAPIVHENDPERAVRTALEMLTEIPPLKKRLKRKHGFDFEVRIGINSGSVIAGKIGTDRHTEYTVIGDTVNLAKRLEEGAQPDTIQVSKKTYQITKSLFKYKELAPLALKGIPQPVPIYRPLAVKERPYRTRGLPGLDTPMIGREKDLARLQKALRESIEMGISRTVLLTGDAGVGKSRLVSEFRSSLHDLKVEVKVHQGNCPAYTRSKPLWVVADLMRDILNLSQTDPESVQRKILQSYLEEHGLANEDTWPYLTLILGLEPEDDNIVTLFRQLDVKMLKRQTYTALRKLFLTLAHSHPRVLIFEDLHWIDPASKDFLEYLIRTVSESPLMLILISRQLERKTVLSSLVKTARKDEALLVDIQLQALSDTEGQRLTNRIITESTDKAEAVKKRIAERAEGNPLYVEEIIRMLIDQRKLEKINGTWRVIAGAEELLQKVPGSLKGLVLARYDELPDTLRRTLYQAAVLGTSFPMDLLAQMKRVTSKNMAEQLGELQVREFIVAKPFKSYRGYAFRHSLIQEAVYNTLLKESRQKIHLQAALAIVKSTIWSPTEYADVLALHFFESNKPTRAIPYLIKAAERARLRGANETAIEHYRRTMTLLPEHLKVQKKDIIEVRLGLGKALKFIGKYQEARQVFSEALRKLEKLKSNASSSDFRPTFVELLRELADVRQREGAYEEAMNYLESSLKHLKEITPPENRELTQSVMDRIAWIHFRQGELQKALDVANESIESVEAEEANPVTLASLYNTMGGICWQQGKLDEAVVHIELSLKLYSKLSYSWGIGVAYINLGLLHDIMGHWSKAAKYYQKAYTLQKTIGDLENQAISLYNTGGLSVASGNQKAARRYFNTALAISNRLGDSFGVANSRTGLAELALIERRFHDAARHAEVSLALSKAIGGKIIEVCAGWILALVQAETGDLQKGLATARQALQMARVGGFQDEEINCLRTVGLLLVLSGDFSEAVQSLQGSLELSRKLKDPYRQGLAFLELGHAYLGQVEKDGAKGEPIRANAAESIQQAITIFESLGATYKLQQAIAAKRKCTA